MAKVSVIVPTYNRARLVRLAITSALKQTFQDFEIIVVDDASTDDTSEAVNSFRDQRIKYTCHDNNKGVAAARNTGLLNATGKYIAFLDDDDEWLPEKLQKQFGLLEESPPIIGVVYTGAFGVETSTRTILSEWHATKRGNIFDHLFIENQLTPTSTVFLRKQCFEKVGLFDETLKFGEDYDMWLRISREFHFDCINQPLVTFSVHDQESLSGNFRNYQAVIKSIENQLTKYAHLLALNRKALSLRYLALGDLYCCVGNIEKGREALLKAIKLYPLELRSYYNLALSLLGRNRFRAIKQIKNRAAARLRQG